MLPASKSRIDKAGRALSHPPEELTEEDLELEEVFDQYREAHLQPLTSLTATIQNSMNERGEKYYLAQRLKRKPQILRKLNRLSSRLTQLQDIGGLRIIAETNDQADRIALAVDELLLDSKQYNLLRTTDYRPYGRDDSGYRALHKVVGFGSLFLEVQIRSRAQHYWAESVERTSVFYGKRLKEGEGSNIVLLYFKNLSNLFREIERGFKASADSVAVLERLRVRSEDVIRRDGHAHLMDGHVNEDVIKTILQKEQSNPGKLNNWILVFDWKTASFVTWDIVSREADEAVRQYARYERDFPEDKLFEVVLVGSSDILTVQKTHSHYFGLSKPDKLLEDLGQSVRSFVDDAALDYGAKKILNCLYKRKVWGEGQGIQRSTLRNHFCKDVEYFEASLDILLERELVLSKGGAGVTLNVSKTAEIENIL